MNSTAPHVYVDCEIPEGMTILEWRRSRHPRKPRSLLRRLARPA